MRLFTLALLFLIPFSPHAAEHCVSRSLNILLGNDDGFDTDGMVLKSEDRSTECALQHRTSIKCGTIMIGLLGVART